jgi:hypothetical protein
MRRWGVIMYLCYVDESGTSDIPGNTSHFVLAGICVPIWHWKDCDRELRQIKQKYGLGDAEIHTAWMLRKYTEQIKVPNFDALNHTQRQTEVERLRTRELLRLQKSPSNKKLYRQTKKNYKHTNDYIHLTLGERKQFVLDVADCVSQWGFARLFAECIEKAHFGPSRSANTVDEQAFEQVISRYEQYLQAMANDPARKGLGVVIHDNNETVAKKHTELMRSYHRSGTFWTKIENIIETPLFVDSQLTGMVQIADLCAYGLRRYLENHETEIFDKVFVRADRRYGLTVGVRHFSELTCPCTICKSHKSNA